MRIKSLILPVIAAAGCAYSQATLSHPQLGPPHVAVTPESYRLALVEASLNEGPPLKRGIQLHRMGDEVASDLLKTIGANQSLSQTQRNTSLALLQEAFAKPELIKNKSDRDPKLTMFVLQWLSNSDEDPDVKDRISGVQQKIQAALSQNKDIPQQ
jgi:hypothetical protein